MISLASVRSCAVIGVVALLSMPVAAEVSEKYQARYQTLLEELRCLVCQNQTLAESNAELAGELRDQVSSMLEEGAGDEAILTFMTERYGDFVRYRPPFNARTWLLWLTPLILLATLLAALTRFVLRRQKSARKVAK